MNQCRIRDYVIELLKGPEKLRIPSFPFDCQPWILLSSLLSTHDRGFLQPNQRRRGRPIQRYLHLTRLATSHSLSFVLTSNVHNTRGFQSTKFSLLTYTIYRIPRQRYQTSQSNISVAKKKTNAYFIKNWTFALPGD